MDVREYTLYQKWCEVKEKYPLMQNTLYDAPTLKNSQHEKDIVEIKSKIWKPEHPDDYFNLKPKMILWIKLLTSVLASSERI